jgi:hypothetical protein
VLSCAKSQEAKPRRWPVSLARSVAEPMAGEKGGLGLVGKLEPNVLASNAREGDFDLKGPVASAIGSGAPVASAIGSGAPVASAIGSGAPVASAIGSEAPVAGAIGSQGHADASFPTRPRSGIP